jgi:hypothetical protein
VASPVASSRHRAGRTDRVECVGLAARTTLAPQPTDLEHLLAAGAEEARQSGAEGTGAFDRERTPTRRVLLNEPERLRVAVAARRAMLASNTTAPLTTSTTASACESRCGSTPTT